MTDLERISALTTNARNTWFTMLAALLFVGVTLMGVEHIDFYGVDRATQLPLIGVEVPTPLFFLSAPVLVAAIYSYFHLYLIRLFDVLGTQNTRIDGTKLSDAVPPWLVLEVAVYIRSVARNDSSLASRPLNTVSFAANLLLAWILGPFILWFCWSLSFSARDLVLSSVAAFCLFCCCGVGVTSIVHMFESMSRELRGPLFAIKASSMLIFGVGLIGVTLARTGGDARTLAPLSLHGEQLTQRPAGWLGPLNAELRARQAWCKRSNEDCSVFSPSQLQPFYLEWRELRSGQISVLRTPSFNPVQSDSIRIALEENIERIDVGDGPSFEDFDDAIMEFRILASDFRGADLRNIFAAGTNLSAARMTGVKLEGANLERADLSFADFSSLNGAPADLTEAVLSRSELELAEFTDAQMWRVQLEAARFRLARFTNADMTEANLRNTFGWNAIFRDAVLTRTRLEGADLSSSKFQGATLAEANLREAKLSFARFDKANLSLALLENTNLDYSIFNEARLDGAFISGSIEDPNILLNTDFSSSSGYATAFRNVDLSQAITNESTEFGNAFFDASVVWFDGTSLPCQAHKGPSPLPDEEFFGRWRGWVEISPVPQISGGWDLIAPAGWENVDPIAPTSDCNWTSNSVPTDE